MTAIRHPMRRMLLGAAGLCAACAGAADRPAAPDRAAGPVYRCLRIGREIALTGRMDDPLWKRAPAARLSRADTGAAPRFATEARLLCSDSTLFVGFRCEDDHVWGTKTAHDADVWTEECVEVFVSPSGALHQYYEINVNPKNAVYDSCVLNPDTGPDGGGRYRGLADYHVAGLRTSVKVEGEANLPGGARGWTVEYAIPLAELIGAPHVPPRPGDRWRMNLYRIDRPAGKGIEFYSWSPTEVNDFHRPWKFGVVEFGE